ncbi:MAG: proton-conducting transporter membrane subunit [Spirochaetales bacterium]|uniref:Proton-conducting transporter membrane subunit n=1 Tax=Candidatus Thalassospirochaeta sargassi TaxID=3119039 RepID=A0AAJ1MIB7_9SPIO|nr:proton-conducting transporter membrane subunit [Spirochaetales bacterium]
MLKFIIIYLFILIAAGIITTVIHKRKKTVKFLIPLISIAAGLLLVYTVMGFRSFQPESLKTGWSMPLADIEIALDSLSLFIMVPLLILTAATSIYGLQYFGTTPPGRMHWLNFSLLTAGMIMVLISRNVLLFMLSWEIMSFSSFLLVISNAEKDSIRRAGWIYLISAHLGTAFLFTAFFLLGKGAGYGSESFSFSYFSAQNLSAARANLILIFALAGFGLKAGFIPFHIWLPLAHPAAPSHVSALMSGIMIKMGIYGILRVLSFLSDQYTTWWAVMFITIGAASGIIGIMFAIGQHDIKRLLAYSSVENIGIIMLGIGLGILGVSTGHPMISTFGFAGALLHILNHALFKGLLFLGAGAVIRQNGTGEIDTLGGLLKKMPLTGTLFLAASIAISGLPLFNGFISEIFIYAGAITGVLIDGGAVLPLISALIVMSLALIGGLAAACFAKVFGVIFQGSPRMSRIKPNGDVPALMRGGMLFVAAFLLITGLFSFLLVPLLEGPLLIMTAGESAGHMAPLFELSKSLSRILPFILGIIILFTIAGSLRRRKRGIRPSETWGCGYTRPEPSMQYTASSFTEPITEQFSTLTASRRKREGGTELFPVKPWIFSSNSNDWFLSGIFIRLAKVLDKLLSLLRWFQCGKAGIYVLYITAAVIILFIWKFII